MLSSLVVLRSSTWLVDTPSLPHGRDEAEDRHSNFYDSRVNLLGLVSANRLRNGVSRCSDSGGARQYLVRDYRASAANRGC
jgi:hypothetical protein